MRSIAPRQATTAGIPSDFARIAVWLVRPPRTVTRARTVIASSCDVSAGDRSSATSTNGCPGAGTRHRQSEQKSDSAGPDVVEIGRALGEVPTERHEELLLLAERAVDGPGSADAVPDSVRHRVGDGGVASDQRLGVEHVGCRRNGVRGPPLELKRNLLEGKDGSAHVRLCVGAGPRLIRQCWTWREPVDEPGPRPRRDDNPAAKVHAAPAIPCQTARPYTHLAHPRRRNHRPIKRPMSRRPAFAQ